MANNNSKGGRPSRGTPADRRLSRNKPAKPAAAPKPAPKAPKAPKKR